MALRSERYRQMLTDVACELTDNDSKELAFRVPFKPSDRCKITNGFEFLELYEKYGYISTKNVTKLHALLKERKFITAAEIVEKYQSEVEAVERQPPASNNLQRIETIKDNDYQGDSNAADAQSRIATAKESYNNVSKGNIDNSSHRDPHAFQSQPTKHHQGVTSRDTCAETLSSENMVVYVACDTRENMTLTATPSHTIRNVKEIIRDKHKIPLNQQRLVYRGNRLEDSKTLSNFNIKKGSTIQLVLRQSSTMQIYVKTDNGEITIDDIQPADTIGYVKSKIQDKTGIPCKDKTLVFRYTTLEEEKTLSDYRIERESMLNLL